MTNARENTPLGQAIASEIETSMPQWIEVCRTHDLAGLEVFIQRSEAADDLPTFRLDFGEASLDSDRQEQIRSAITSNVEHLWSRVTAAFPQASSEEFAGFAFEVVADGPATESTRQLLQCVLCCSFWCCQSDPRKRTQCWNLHCPH